MSSLDAELFMYARLIKFGKLEAEEHADISEENEIVAVYVLLVLNVLTQCCRPRPSSLLSILLSPTTPSTSLPITCAS